MSIQAESRFLACGHSAIHYLVFGCGKQVLFAFHGFGENADTFEVLEPSLGQRFTVYAIDFPFHGKTQWDANEPLNRKMFIAWFDRLLKANNIEKFSVLGYSMGARLAMSILMAFPDRVRSIFLLAADGIKTHPVFNIAMYPAWGRFLFKKVMSNPRLFFAVLRLLFKLHIVSKFLFNFTQNHMDTPEKRQRIFFTWNTLKEFIPDVQVLKKILTDEAIPTYLFFGRYDEVTPPKTAVKFSKNLPDCYLQIIPHGHRLIAPFMNAYLEKALSL